MAKISTIQIGRAAAATSVVLCHTLHEAEKWPDVDPRLVAFSHYMPFGYGVDIFFVISGFVMYYISQSRRETPGYWKSFLENRVIRIVPVYWAFTLIMVGLVLALPQAFDTARFDIWQILRSFLFLPGRRPRSGGRSCRWAGRSISKCISTCCSPSPWRWRGGGRFRSCRRSSS